MAVDFDPLGMIAELEQRDRDHARPAGPPMWGPHVEQPAFWQITGLARFWDGDVARKEGGGEVDFAQHLCDLLAGLHTPGRTVRYLLAGTPEGVGVYLGVSDEPATGADPLPVILRGLFPGIELAKQAQRHLGKPLHKRGLFAEVGMLTGIPTLKLIAKPQDGRGVTQQIERLLRGLAGQTWGYLVSAAAVPQPTALSLTVQGLQQVTQVSSLVKQQISRQSAQKERVDGHIQTTTSSAEQTNYEAKQCLELLEKNLERLQIGKAEGLWQVTVYYFGATPTARDQGGALLRAIFSGPDSTPEPVRVFARQTDPQMTDQDHAFTTLLNSREVGALCQLPREEFPGFALRDYARFDTDPPPGQPHDPVTLGRVLDGGQPVGHSYVMERRDLTKHGLIVGVTGAGKTTTVFSLLDQLYAQGKGTPFLVIEPAKTEYRLLLKAGGRFPDLRIYTLGDERSAPFRLNPFAFAIGDAQHRIHVQTHIDFLKAVFNAAFVLYAPMPYVLETCLHEIYTDKGWDLATGVNLRLPLAQQGSEADWPVFPTLSDLYHKVEEVVDRLGYEERIEMDVKAGLKARIGSLRLGGKGFMLDSAHSLPMADLLAHPTVLEMASIGNEDEKAFILGLLLTALYEHHIIQQQMAPAPTNDLVHLTVLEEAHRLLKNVPTEVDTESANTRGQAVETFTNMLSEIRAYGEGVLIAEQIPTKLAPDAIKNTNLKIVHRLLAGDDREVLAATMNMDDAQSRYLTTLRAGQAVLYAEGADHPYLLGMENFKARLAGARVVDADVQQLMAPVVRSPIYAPTPDFDQHFPPALVQLLAQQNIPLSLVRNRALQLIDTAEFQGGFDRFVLGIVEKPAQSAAAFGWLRRLAMQQWVDAAALRPTILYAVLVALEQHAERRGRLYRWAYHRTGNAYAPLRRALGHLAQEYPYVAADPTQAKQKIDQITARIEADLLAFGAAYRKLTAVNAPYNACQYCQTCCRYRHEAAQAAQRRDQRESFGQALETPDDVQMWQRIAQHCQEGAFQVVGVSKSDLPADAVICYALHAAQVMELSTKTQLKIVKNVAALVKSTP
ncbi:MAG TPA: DUF87 domain-containing protein [Caldilinea sp.]|nr:DUF87 domain-containing protein [Caldilinea sp.]